MTENQTTLTGCLQKARELRITDGYGLYILVKVPDIHEYRLINTADAKHLRLWLEKQTHEFVCLIDVLDILLIDSTLPMAELHQLFTDCENLAPEKRNCGELTDFLELLKEMTDATQTSVPH